MRNQRTINPRSARAQSAFTLIELLTVIAIIAIIAALLFPAFSAVKRRSIIQQATSERDALETAIESYKAKYGFYPPGNPNSSLALTNQLYYELVGTTNYNNAGTVTFTTLDNASSFNSTNVIVNEFGVSGFMNSTRGSGEDQVSAKNFIPALKASQIATNSDGVYVIVTAVDSGTYAPMSAGFVNRGGYSRANPWRYLYPGVNNTGSYDLWVQIIVGGKTNLICNWKDQPIINSPLP